MRGAAAASGASGKVHAALVSDIPVLRCSRISRPTVRSVPNSEPRPRAVFPASPSAMCDQSLVTNTNIRCKSTADIRGRTDSRH